MKTLQEVRPNETVRVVRLHGQGPVKRRIMDMGITKGTVITVRKCAPLGDPIEINLRNYELSLRKADAAMIEVEYHQGHGRLREQVRNTLGRPRRNRNE